MNDAWIETLEKFLEECKENCPPGDVLIEVVKVKLRYEQHDREAMKRFNMDNVNINPEMRG